MNFIRWLSFLPLAFVASLFTGAVGTYIAEQLYTWQWLIWMVSGSLSAGAFILVGVRVAPRVTGIVKWSLIALLFGLGATSTLGSRTGSDPVKVFAGIAMMVVAVVRAGLSVPQFESMKSES